MFPFDRARFEPLLAELDQWREKLDYRGPLARAWAGRLRRDLEVESVAASTIMEGVPVTVDEVRRILVGDRPAEVSEGDARLVAGYRDAMGLVLRRADDTGFEWSRELFASIHDRVLGGRFSLDAGRLRTNATWIVDRETGLQVFAPPEPEDVPELIDRLCGVMTTGFGHPAVDAAWVHAATAAVHPFRDGNGRTSRILASLAMYRGGIRRPEFGSLEEWWGRHLTDYYGSFACLGTEFNADADITPLVRAHLEAQLHQVRALDLRERTQRRIWQAIETVAEDLGLQPRMANAMWDAFFDRTVTSRAYRAQVDVSAPTATNDLAAGTSAGVLVAEGEGRSRAYERGTRLLPLVGDAIGIQVADDAERARAEIVSHASSAALAVES